MGIQRQLTQPRSSMALLGNQLAQDWDKSAWESAAAEVAPVVVVDDDGVAVVAAAAVPVSSSLIALHQSISERMRLEELESPLCKFPSRGVVAEAWAVQGLDHLYCLRQCSIKVEGEEVDEPVVKTHCEDKSGHLFHALASLSRDLDQYSGQCVPEEELIPADSICLEL